jgi:cytochrome c biogenesis protein CcmG/thiol:disulfide interchange protein DsbE
MRCSSCERGGRAETVRARILALAVLLCTVFVVYAFRREAAAVGRTAPGFDLPEATGGELTLASLRGRVVLLDFYASWCTVCQQDAPAVETFAARYPGQVRVVGVDWREPAATARRWAQRFGLTYPQAVDASGSVAQHYGLSGVPELWWLGPHGVARLHVVGPATFEQLQADYRTVTGRALPGASLPISGPAAVAAAAVADGRLWIALGAGGLWSRPVGGGGWMPAALPPGTAVDALAASQGTLLAGGSRIWWSADGGGTWRPLPGGAPRGPTALAAGGSMWYAWAGGRLWAAARPGGTWRALAVQPPTGGAAVTALAAGDGEVLAATATAAYALRSGGARWSAQALHRPALGTEVFSSAAQLVTQQVPLRPAAAWLGPGGPLLAAPDGLYGVGGRLPGAPARAFAALAAAPGGTVLAVAPDGDVYAGSQGGPWRLQGAAG